MFVILTSRPGQYRTDPGPGMTPLEAWTYVDAGRLRARFVIARLDAPSRILVVDEGPPPATNAIPDKVLPRFASLDAARDQIAQLGRGAGAHGRLDIQSL